MTESILIFVTLSACTHQHGHPVHLQNVTSYVRQINPTADFMSQKAWLDVLRRQSVVAGHGKPTYAVMKQVNDNCNKKPYKRTPAWPTPEEFAAATAGDCKGYAICKYYALRKAGFAANQLNLWTGDYSGHPHLTLAVKLDNKQYILDAGAEANLPEPKDYFYKNFQPAYRFNEYGWDVN